MSARDDVVKRLEQAVLDFEKASKRTEAAAIFDVAQALRALPPSLADDIVQEIVYIVENGR